MHWYHCSCKFRYVECWDRLGRMVRYSEGWTWGSLVLSEQRALGPDESYRMAYAHALHVTSGRPSVPPDG